MREQVVRFLVRVGTGRTVTAEAARDQPWISAAELRRSQPETIRCSRRQILHEHVGAAEQAREHVSRLVALQIERQRFLPSIQPDEMTRQPAHRRVVRAGEVARAGALDFDHARAEIGQLTRRKRDGNRLLERDDNDAAQGRGGMISHRD